MAGESASPAGPSTSGGFALREVRYRPRAAFDLESIVVYVGEVLGSPQATKKLYAALVGQIAQLAEMPELGKPFYDQALDRRGYRSFLVEQYRIFYTYDDDALTVWRVIHVRQDIDDYALIDWRS